MMGVDLLAIVDSYYQNTKPSWNSDEHNIARSLVMESAQDHYDNLLLKQENKKLKAQLDQAVEALRYYAEPESWTDFASEEMEPEDFPAWTAEVNLPTKSFFIEGGIDMDGWTVAKAAIAATEDE